MCYVTVLFNDGIAATISEHPDMDDALKEALRILDEPGGRDDAEVEINEI